MALSFEALYHRERLHLINPFGDVGVITLWSPWDTVEKKLRSFAPELLDPRTSRVAVIANLYGNGMFAMFCNLLYNPQIRHLVAFGADAGVSTCDEISAFLADGLEDASVLGVEQWRVRGTSRVFRAAPGFEADTLRARLSFTELGGLRGLENRLGACLAALPVVETAEPRLRVDYDTSVPDDYAYLPSEIAGHQVIRRTPIDCWEELAARVLRFGRPVELASGQRLELLNAKVVITEPAQEPDAALRERGFDPDAFRAYEAKMLEAEMEEGVAYSYGHRLRGHFPQLSTPADALQTAIERLRDNPETRGAYISLWDTAEDLPAERGTPCLTTIFFRRSDGRLTLSATYRAHNLLDAWLRNVYGLMSIQRHVAAAVGMPVGAITVISHSLGADPSDDRYPVARARAGTRDSDWDFDPFTGKRSMPVDPNGEFEVSVDGDEIVVHHTHRGLLLREYRADRADRIARQISGDMAVTLPSHALWLGQELARKEQQLKARTRERISGDDLRVLEVERFDRAELLERLSRTRLVGFDGAHAYREGSLTLTAAVPTDLLTPAQRYVLMPTVRKVAALRAALLEFGLDIFALDGGAFIRTSDAPDERVPVIPPVVEESHEPDGRVVRLINDGMHRVYAARLAGLPITVVEAVEVPQPYYALALADGWDGVQELEALPDAFEKKTYRIPANYKALFRDFNAVFPGVQAERKKSNPEHLRA